MIEVKVKYILFREDMGEHTVRLVLDREQTTPYALATSARFWCYDEVLADESSPYKSIGDLLMLSDVQLCSAVLAAWKNIAEDKGLL